MSPTTPPPNPHLPPARAAELHRVVTRTTRWATDRPDIAGLLLVGSCARGAAGAGSDVDLVLLTDEPEAYAGTAWAGQLGLPVAVRTRRWGAVVERRFATPSGLEVEFAIGPPSWADTSPLDPGTRRVVGDGALVLHDPAGLLARLVEACRG
ncbi:nucleotidyltransferase domain-containing protein [Streptomyces sp. 891-h]|uniref:nucleotidyltransferase domain-containing protein n=1 Tax=unclassified Streptomyces TaxID=2593676 RepID=UPI001FA957B9|nr:nucleotidyltransferase domain-containing protein [Streptomyces sp. 891-h]UNZ16481.1 nucleotidyltransferase domain-containing protein [Streptomyces sp. 891-h]